MKGLKIILADDCKEFREAVEMYLSREFFPMEVIGKAKNGAELLEMKNINQADIILMDINMPEMNGIETTKKLLWENPHLKIIAVTMHTEKVYLKELIEAGFKGCVFKNDLFFEISDAILKVMNNELHFPKNIKI